MAGAVSTVQIRTMCGWYRGIHAGLGRYLRYTAPLANQSTRPASCRGTGIDRGSEEPKKPTGHACPQRRPPILHARQLLASRPVGGSARTGIPVLRRTGQPRGDTDLLGRGGGSTADANITDSGCGSLSRWAAHYAGTPAAGPLASGPGRLGDLPAGPASRLAGISGGSPAGRSCRLASCSGGGTSRTAAQLEQQPHGLGGQLHPAFDSQLDA